MDLSDVIGHYGEAAAKKLGEIAITGEPEDQLRAPLEALIEDLATLAQRDPKRLSVVGETSLADLQTRPDFAVSYHGTLVGFVEVKAPGKGADPRKFREGHDREQWKKLQALPNLIYTDGQAFSLWRDGEIVGEIVALDGEIASAGRKLGAPSALLGLFDDFLQWHPIAPRRPKQLAEMTARLCRLLRDEVTEQLGHASPALTSLAEDWRHLLFPLATDAWNAPLRSRSTSSSAGPPGPRRLPKVAWTWRVAALRRCHTSRAHSRVTRRSSWPRSPLVLGVFWPKR